MDRRAATRAYKESPPPGGVYAIRNTEEDRTFIGASANVAGRLNRERFQLEMGSHRARELQADWNRLGPGAFEFTVLDTLDPSEDPDADAAEELAQLLEMWLDKLALPADKLYKHR